MQVRILTIGSLLILGCGVWFGLAQPIGAATSGCKPMTTPQYSPAKVLTTILTPANQRTSTPPPINFSGNSGQVSTAPYTYTVAGGTPDTRAIAWEVSLIDGNSSFPARDLYPSFTDNLDGFEVRLCATAGGVNPGSYVGTLAFAGGAMKPVQLPLTINVRYAGGLNYLWIVLGLLLAALIGVFVKWWMILINKPTGTNIPNLLLFLRWMKAQWVTVAMATASAGYAVVRSKYLANPSFNSGDLMALWIAMGVATSASALLVTTLGKLAQPSQEKEPDQKA